VAVQIRMVRSRNDLETFIQLPLRIYQNWPNHTPPLLRDERRLHDPLFNAVLGICDTVYFLAESQNQIVGRVMGIIHHHHNEKYHELDVRFFQLDCINKNEVASSLLDAVCMWGQSMGMRRLIGPFGFSDKDPQGIQIEGPDDQAVLSSASHPPYMHKLIERWGFSKFKDCVSYCWKIDSKLPSVYEAVAQRIMRTNHYAQAPISNRKALKPYFPEIMDLMNRAYEDIYGFEPLSDIDVERLAQEFLDFIDPDYVKIIVNQNQRVIAFVIAMANMSEGFRKAKGRLWPLGALKLWRSMKKSSKLDLLLGAVEPKLHGKGITSIMALSLLGNAAKKGMKTLDSHLILEENKSMRAEMERLGAQLFKRYRIYQKVISN